MIIILELKNVNKKINKEDIFKEMNFSFESGQIIFIIGETGSGKTSLLNIIANIDKDYEGEVLLFGENLRKSDEVKIFKNLSYIRQLFPLIPYYTIKENIQMFSEIEDENIEDICSELEIEELLYEYPIYLSGGERQRVAIAHALLKNTPLLLADEPTSSLNEELAEKVMLLLKEKAKTSLVIIVTHNKEMAKKHGDYILDLGNNRVQKINQNQNQTSSYIYKERIYSFKKIIVKQIQIMKKKKVKYIFPIFLWLIINLTILLSLQFEEFLIKKLERDIEKRIDSDYLQLNVKDEITQNLAKIIQEDYLLLKPYHEFLNNNLVSNLYFYEEKPFYKQFFFEIIPLLSLEKEEVIINKKFYEKCNFKIERIFLSFTYESQIFNYNLKVMDVIDDGSLYQNPKIYVSYDFCLEQWPTYENENQILLYSKNISTIIAALVTQEFSFLFSPIVKENSFYNSTYLIFSLRNDILNIYRYLVIFLIFIFGLMICTLQSKIFSFLLEYKDIEIKNYRLEGISKIIIKTLILYDLFALSILSIFISSVLYVLPTIIINLFSNGILGKIKLVGLFYVLVGNVIFVSITTYLMLKQEKEKGETRWV